MWLFLEKEESCISMFYPPGNYCIIIDMVPHLRTFITNSKTKLKQELQRHTNIHFYAMLTHHKYLLDIHSIHKTSHQITMLTIGQLVYPLRVEILLITPRSYKRSVLRNLKLTQIFAGAPLQTDNPVIHMIFGTGLTYQTNL